MTPDYRITVDGEDVTAKFRQRLISLTIVDRVGIKSDTLTIELDDGDSKVNIPRRGAKVQVFLGYKEMPPLMLMGQYVVDDADYTFYSPNKLVIKAKAADFYLASKEKSLKTRSFDQQTLGGIVQTVAGDMGLQAVIASELASITIPHIDQVNESNLHFLTRLAKTYDATAKPAGGKLVFAQSGSGKSATGQALPVIIVPLSDTQPGATLGLAGRSEYDGVTTHWHDPAVAQQKQVHVGGANRKVLRGNYATEAEARAAAQAELQKITREPLTLNFDLKRGNPLMRAEIHAETDATWRKPEAIGRWRVKQATHKLTRKPGYSTSVQTEAALT